MQTEPIEKFWKNIHPTQIQQQKLKVSVANFNSESTPRENNPTNEKVSSEKIAKTLEGERSYQAFKSVINTGGYENETFKSTFEKSNIRVIKKKCIFLKNVRRSMLKANMNLKKTKI